MTNLLERHVLFRAAVAHAARGLRREAKQRANRGTRPASRTQLQDLAEQHERDNHGRGFEVNGHRSTLVAEGGREDLRRQRGDDAVHVGDADAERDQGEHVEAAVDE